MVRLARPSAVSSFAPNPVSGLPPSFVKTSAGTSTPALVSGTSNRFQFVGSAQTSAGHSAAATRTTNRFDLIRSPFTGWSKDERHGGSHPRPTCFGASGAHERQTMLLAPICSAVQKTWGTSGKPAACFLNARLVIRPERSDEGFRQRFVFSRPDQGHGGSPRSRGSHVARAGKRPPRAGHRRKHFAQRPTRRERP